MEDEQSERLRAIEIEKLVEMKKLSQLEKEHQE
jgi:hypothetical protein